MNTILAVNAGSSSLKFALYEHRDSMNLLARGEVDGLPDAPCFRAIDANGAVTRYTLEGRTTAIDALGCILDWLARQFPHVAISVVGNRIVHGGGRYSSPMLLDEQVLSELDQFVPLAPLHQLVGLAVARALRVRFPYTASVACFDTSFHAAWPDVSRRLPLPRRWHDLGIRRFGFHGLSFEYLSERLGVLAPHARRVVLAHLGSGSSVCAVLNGRSVDATMGFSTLDGLPMATRVGTLDPGVFFHLHRVHGLSVDAIESMLYHDSGVKGVSGTTGDMRRLLASDACEAREAIDLFAYRCAQAVAAMTVTLGGIDALAFSGGIGANAPPIRSAVCAKLGCLGVRLAPRQNNSNNQRIGAANSKVRVYAIATDEEHVIAKACRDLTDYRDDPPTPAGLASPAQSVKRDHAVP